MHTGARQRPRPGFVIDLPLSRDSGQRGEVFGPGRAPAMNRRI